MKTIVLALASFIAVTAHAQNRAALNPGDAMPGADIKLKNANGAETAIKEVMGKNGELVMFSCNTCPFVIKNQAATQRTRNYAKAHGIGVVIINSNEGKRSGDDSYEAMEKYARSQKYNVPYLVDENSKLADLFGASHTPEIFLFNNQGKLVYKGAMNDNPGSPEEAKEFYIEKAMDAVVSGGEVDPKVTKSVGCSIKRKA